ncbi:MAG: response regulator [Myxococcota bacterium]
MNSSMVGPRPKVLCVDDEREVLEGLALHLRRGHAFHQATSGAEALEVIDQQGPFAVVVSDMRMPGMDGATLLKRVRAAAPDTTRILLTGQADVQSAIAAVNEGQIFRFLTKPCPPDRLRGAVRAGVEQHRLVTAERVLLEQTLRGAVKTLTDVLALTSPAAFGRAARIRDTAREMADRLDLEARWQLDVAAMVSQLGSVAVPDDVLENHVCGRRLTDEQEAMVQRIPALTEELLANIPRLEPVREILRRAFSTQGASKPARTGEADPLVLAASVLRMATELDERMARGDSSELAVQTILGRSDAYEPAVLEAFADLQRKAAPAQVVREVPLHALAVGMVLAEDMRSTTDLLLVARGARITPSFLQRARNYPRGFVREPLRVMEEVS